jgi:hypothetical protein
MSHETGEGSCKCVVGQSPFETSWRDIQDYHAFKNRDTIFANVLGQTGPSLV